MECGIEQISNFHVQAGKKSLEVKLFCGVKNGFLHEKRGYFISCWRQWMLQEGAIDVREPVAYIRRHS
jgi:hypothetical protein